MTALELAAALDDALKSPTAFPTHTLTTMKQLKAELSELVDIDVPTRVDEDATAQTVTAIADDIFNGIPPPSFSVGSPGPPPEEADLIGTATPEADLIMVGTGTGIAPCAPAATRTPPLPGPPLQPRPRLAARRPPRAALHGASGPSSGAVKAPAAVPAAHGCRRCTRMRSTRR